MLSHGPCVDWKWPVVCMLETPQLEMQFTVHAQMFLFTDIYPL